jgi:predicted GNAT family N-acyltransferase
MNLEIRIAETKEEQRKIYQLRYKVYVEEMNRPCHADHENKVLTDWLDETGVLLYAIDKGKNEFVATLRLNFRKHGVIEFEKEYNIESFKEYYPNNISTSTKLIILKDYRKTRLPLNIICFGYNCCMENGSMLDFINVNAPLDKFYWKLGYKQYKENFNHPEFGEVIPMVLHKDDFKFKKYTPLT